MNRWVQTMAAGVTACGLFLLMGCGKEEPAPAVQGLKPGDRAVQRAVPYFFTLVRLEERDRVFNMMDKANEGILASLKQLDEPRLRLIRALEQAAHMDLAILLGQKRLTCTPEPVEVVAGTPKVVEYKIDDTNATVKIEYRQPDGQTRQGYVPMKKEGLTWRMKMPPSDKPDGRTTGSSPDEIRAEIEKVVPPLRKTMQEFSERLEAGEMIESSFISQVLAEAARPLSSAVQKMIYGQTNL